MPVSLSIKNAPDDVVERLRHRAARNHRSLQGELLSIITDAADATAHISPLQLVSEFRAKGYATADEATAMIREDRALADGRR